MLAYRQRSCSRFLCLFLPHDLLTSTVMQLKNTCSVELSWFSKVYRLDSFNDLISTNWSCHTTGIKSDAIFNYWPPVNLLALIFLVPIRFVITPRRFHSLNVLCTRESLCCISIFLSSYDRYFIFPGISAGPILILIALCERRIFGLAKATSSIGTNAELRVTRGLSRFEARADVEALLNLFVNDDRGLRPEPYIPQSRHRSVSSVIEQESNHKKRDGEASFDSRWQNELQQRLENIEGALLELSKR